MSGTWCKGKDNQRDAGYVAGARRRNERERERETVAHKIGHVDMVRLCAAADVDVVGMAFPDFDELVKTLKSSSS